MSMQLAEANAPGLQHYDDLLTLTGRRYRFTDGRWAIGIVLGMLDQRTGCLPIGLVDARNAYWAETLYYDANRRMIDVYDQARWSAFVETYAGGGWLLALVKGLGGVSLVFAGTVGSVALDSLRFFLVPAILFGLVGLLVYGLMGYVLVQMVLQVLPYLVGGLLAWGGLCGILAFERHKRCDRISLALEIIIERQLRPVFG
ncbi:hypothetical protein MKK68_07720 [Methylobacterium sp. E-016]|uniref:hypothetical protein n=1 Tax=Methylobacterium sp. E-016 TaxID=2836556 RepID=UPI001FB9B326|nr:hypothetical protein [Methylobacterium sp. E-016]MCJ2075542.1 hypothetical protein [Methylobacterium sp. E-016]